MSPIIISVAYALSTASTTTTCAFQTPAASSQVVGVAKSLGNSDRSIESIALKKRRGRVFFDVNSRRSDNEQITSMEGVDLYKNDGEEIDIQIDLENIEEDFINDYYSSGNVDDEEEEAFKEDDADDGNKTKNKKLIECSASIMLPFSEDVAFDAFSDLTRQP